MKGARGGQSVPTTKLSLCLPPSLSRTKSPKSLWFEWEREGEGGSVHIIIRALRVQGFFWGVPIRLWLWRQISLKRETAIIWPWYSWRALGPGVCDFSYFVDPRRTLKIEPSILCNFGPNAEILSIYFQNAVGPLDFGYFAADYRRQYLSKNIWTIWPSQRKGKCCACIAQKNLAHAILVICGWLQAAIFHPKLLGPFDLINLRSQEGECNPFLLRWVLGPLYIGNVEWMMLSERQGDMLPFSR